MTSERVQHIKRGTTYTVLSRTPELPEEPPDTLHDDTHIMVRYTDEEGRAQIVIATLQTDNPLTAQFTDLVLYRDVANGSVWLRPVAEFDDPKRFTKIEAS